MNSDGNEEEMAVKKAREKSAKYPYYNLRDCISFAGMVRDLAGKSETTESAVLHAMGLASSSNKQFSYKMSSAIQFGLIEKTPTGIKVTELGRLIMYPPEGETQKKALIKKAFASPPLYKKLIEKYSEIMLPDTLSHVLIDMDIAVNMSERAASIFVESANFAEVLQNGVLKNETIAPTGEQEKPFENSPNNPIGNFAPIREPKNEEKSGYIISIKGSAINLSIIVKNKDDPKMEIIKKLLEGLE